MVTVDDATYVKMRDTLYWGDEAKATTARQKIENTYTDQKYNSFVSQLNNMGSQTSASSNNWWPADWYATASERNAATWWAEFISQTKNQTSETPTVVKDETKTETVVETPEIKQEWALKPLDQDYYDQTSQEAQDKIVKNLEEYKKNNPEYFSDYESFKKNFSYDARSEAQKNTLDQWFNWYQKWLQLSTVPTTDLYTQYNDWDLSNADLEILRANNPTKYSELMNQINKWNIIAAYDDDNGANIVDFQSMAYEMMQKAFMSFMGWDDDSWASKYFADYKEKMASPEMMELSDQATEYENQIENLQDDIATMQKAVEEEYAWKWASRAKISAIVADRTYELQLQLRTANSNYKRVATQYNNRMQQYQNEFQLWLQEYQINQQARQQQMQELWFAMDLMSFETPQQKQDREWNYWLMQQEYKDGNINSKDPAMQLKAIQNSVDSLLQNYAGIPTTRSNVEIAQDIQTAIKNGSSLWEQLTILNKQMQSKDEYKLMYKATYNWKKTLGTINWKSAVISYDAAGNYIWYELLNTSPNSINNSNRSSQIKSFSDVWDLSSNSWDGYIANIENAVQLGSWGWQCGAWANDILSWAWADKVFWNSLADKIKVCDSKYGANASNDYSKLKTWDFVVLDTGAKLQDWTPAGHVWLIKSIDLNNWTITVFDTNGQAGKECWGESTYSLNIVRGSYDPRTQADFREVAITPSPTSEWENAINSYPWYDVEDIWVYDKYLKWTTPSEKYIESAWGWDEFKAKVAAYQTAKANKKVTVNDALYAPYNNPMADAYEIALTDASNVDKSKSLNEAFNFYSQAYSMLNDGSLQELANDSDLQEIIKDAYKNRNKSKVKSDVFTYMYNKKLTDDQRMALNQLKRLCEIKLRKESWAAINAEERESAYEFFFPSIWESSEYSMNKILNNVNSTVWQRFLNWGVSRTDFIPLSVDMITVSSTATPTTPAPQNIDYFEEFRSKWGSGNTYSVWNYTIEW